MRSMLISLILFCSLTQLAIADDTPPASPLAPNDALKGCGFADTVKDKLSRIYECYMPEKCTNDALANKAITEGTVTYVYEDTPVSADCPALLKFYQYTDRLVHVSLESFQENTTIQGIEFKQESTDTPFNGNFKIFTKNAFSCVLENNKQKGRFTDTKYGTNPLTTTYLKYQEADPLTGKLQCAFKVHKKHGPKFFNAEQADQISFGIVSTENKFKGVTKPWEGMYMKDNKKCDPNGLIFNSEVDEESMYEKVRYKPGKYYCEKPGYKLMYRERVDEKYIEATIECPVTQFIVNGKKLPATTIDVRCAAKVKYLCDYDVKTHGNNVGPTRTPGNAAASVESKLECNGANKFLNIVASQTSKKTLLKPKFKCAYHGGRAPVWTVSDEDSLKTPKKLTRDGPEVYCTNKVDCYTRFKLSENQVERGRLNDKFLPQCHKHGTLFSKGSEVFNQTCDESSGHFKYKDAAGDDHIIDGNSKFVCNYPKPDTRAKKAEASRKIYTAAIASGVAAVCVVGIVFAASCAYGVHRQKKEKKRIQTQHEATWLKYCATDDEKKAHYAQKKKERERKNEKESSQSEGEPVLLLSWNSMIMHWQHTAACSLGIDPTTGLLPTEELKTCIKLPVIDAKDVKKTREEFGPDPNDEKAEYNFVNYRLRETYKWFEYGIEKETLARNKQRKPNPNEKKMPKSE